MTNTNFKPLNFELDLKDVSFREGTGISNLDGRLWNEAGAETARFFGDEAMVRARIGIEARYLIVLSSAGVIRKLKTEEINQLLKLHTKVTEKVYRHLRQIEGKIRHDVISTTQIMKMLLLKNKNIADIIDHGWLHWGLGSEDIDNLARSILIKDFLDKIYLPQAAKTLDRILNLSKRSKDIIIPGKTHLQTAVPTILGKEIAIFGVRLAENFKRIKELKLRGKLNGDIGNLNAHRSAIPDVNWLKISRNFVESLNLENNPFTTQIEPKARLVELFQLIQNTNSVLIDMSQDFRIYTGFSWFIQEVKKEESGSSAMPQKVNPIDFENSHGNALLSNWILEGFIRQLPVSWLQRDLVDKTILRNTGLAFGYALISLISAGKGLSRITPNAQKINEELNSDWGALAEAFQTVLRASGQGNAYEYLKELSRGKKLSRGEIEKWITNLKAGPETKQKLTAITFEKYTGYARENLAEMQKIIKKTARKLNLKS